MDPGTTPKRRRTTRILWGAAVVLPIVLFSFTQFDFAQEAQGWFIRGLPWDIGKKDIVADILAPLWALSIVVVAVLERRMLRHYAGLGRLPEPVLRRLVGVTWAATGGAAVIVLMSWTREWARFGEQPDAFWYVVTILGVFVLLSTPVWALRHSIFGDLHDAASSSRTARIVDRYLFDDASGGARWVLTVVFAATCAVVAWTALGELDSLLKGMHAIGGAQVGINELSSVFEFDLSQKLAEVLDKVDGWRVYSQDVGPIYASAIGVTALYLVVESLVFVPAYVVVIGILLLHVRRTEPDGLDASASRSYALLMGVGFLLLAAMAVADLFENLMTWVVVSGAWSTPGTLGDWSVRLMWFGALFRTIAMLLLVAVAVLMLAFRSRRYRWLGDALVAVRGQLLVIVFIGLAIGIAQTEDVVRRWTVSVALVTVLMATALALLVHWSGTQALSRLRREEVTCQGGGRFEPSIVHLPRGKVVSLRRLVVLTIFGLAALQVFLVGALGLEAGLGFVIPSIMIGGLWLFGLAIPEGPFLRGDRSISAEVKRWLPRVLGASIYVILGIVVLRAAIPQLVYARSTNWWLVFCLIPVALGVYRIHSRSWASMGGIELVVISGVSLFGVALMSMKADPELSAVGLTFVGVMVLFGSMPFYFSYDPESLPSRVSARVGPSQVRPLLIGGGAVAVVTGIAIVAFPLSVAQQIGTVAVVLLGGMLFAGFTATAVAFAEVTRPPRILAAFRMKRTPVFVLLLVWLLLAGLASTGASNDIALVPYDGARTDRTIALDEVFDRWALRNVATAEPGTAIPLVVVASSGGGIRAAAWTSYVLDCIFVGSFDADSCIASPRGTDPIAVMSGVSGGSLGLAAWSSSIVSGVAGPGEGDWVKDRLGDDYLASAVAWQLMIDTPRSWFGIGPSVRDRAGTLELAWEQSWDDIEGGGYLAQGMYTSWDRHPELPLPMFNGTSVNDPCRFNASVLSASSHGPHETCTSLQVFEDRTVGVERGTSLAATQDLGDYLCANQDVKASTAVLLSARFPIITPTGRVGAGLADCGEETRDAYVADGSYLDGSGAGSASETWNGLRRHVERYNASHDSCIVPFFIQIDNGYESPSSSGIGSSPVELLVPVQTLFKAMFGRIANERERAAIEFDRPLELGGSPLAVFAADGTRVDSRYARVVTRAHPGVQAPLGWTLSNASFDDLRSQLTIEENVNELSEIRSWLSGDLRCGDRS